MLKLKNIKLKNAWIVLSNGNIIDILSTRNKFNTVLKYAKDIYRLFNSSFYEKSLMAHYNNGEENKIDFFNLKKVFTSIQTPLYKNFMLADHGSQEFYKLKKRVNNSEFIEIGYYNPSLEIRKVSNLIVSRDKNDKEIVEWEQLTPSGIFEKKLYKNL